MCKLCKNKELLNSYKHPETKRKITLCDGCLITLVRIYNDKIEQASIFKESLISWLKNIYNGRPEE